MKVMTEAEARARVERALYEAQAFGHRGVDWGSAEGRAIMARAAIDALRRDLLAAAQEAERLREKASSAEADLKPYAMELGEQLRKIDRLTAEVARLRDLAAGDDAMKRDLLAENKRLRGALEHARPWIVDHTKYIPTQAAAERVLKIIDAALAPPPDAPPEAARVSRLRDIASADDAVRTDASLDAAVAEQSYQEGLRDGQSTWADQFAQSQAEVARLRAAVERVIEEYADHKQACLTRATLLLMDCDCGFVAAIDALRREGQ